MSKHPIVHIELSASDPKAAGEFYANLLGWKIDVDEKMEYVMFSPEPGPGGGFNPITDEMPAGTVLIYVHTDDIQGTLAQAESLGGKIIIPKTEIPTIGWFVIFLDPTGNSIGLFTGLQEE